MHGKLCGSWRMLATAAPEGDCCFLQAMLFSDFSQHTTTEFHLDTAQIVIADIPTSTRVFAIVQNACSSKFPRIVVLVNSELAMDGYEDSSTCTDTAH